MKRSRSMTWFAAWFAAVSALVMSCSSFDSIEGRSGSVQQAVSGSYSSFVTSLGPVVWFKFDETSGTTAIDSTGRGNDGIYHPGDPAYVDDGGLLGIPSGIDGGGTAVHFGTASRFPAPPSSGSEPYLGPYMSTPPAATASPDFSLMKGEDKFVSSVSVGNTWGAPSTTDVPGGSWTWLASSGGYYWVAVPGGSTGPGGVINEMSATGTFGQKFPSQLRLDTDSQVDVNWTDHASNAKTTSGTFIPVLLAARLADSSNYYAAKLTEVNGVVALSIVKKIAGTTTLLAGPTTINSTWDGVSHTYRVRFQIETDRTTGLPTLRAKAWQPSLSATPWLDPNTQPLGWTGAGTLSMSLSADAGTPLAAGANGILSSNSGSNSHQEVSFNRYRLQSTGMTVSAWFRPTTEFFTQETPTQPNGVGALCTVPVVKADYAHWISKQGTGAAEWVFRHYPETAVDPSCSEDRRWATSAYAFSLTPTDPTTNHTNKGAGDRFGPPALTHSLVGVWHHVVGIYDPGDYLDKVAGVLICVDGVCYPHTFTDGGAGNGANYADPAYLVNMSRGSAPFRAGAANPNDITWTQFQGDIDEVTIYDYRLTTQNVTDMYSFKLP